jgi:hypothetical protein
VGNNPEPRSGGTVATQSLKAVRKHPKINAALAAEGIAVT